MVDPAKSDFHAMDCYRMLAGDKMAENLADEVIRASTDFDGTDEHPCASQKPASPSASLPLVKVTSKKQCIAASKPSNGRRKSLPSLLMVSRDLTRILRECYPSERATQTYLMEPQAISQTHEPPAASRT